MALVVVFKKDANQDDAPLRLLQGDDTGLGDPHGIAIDPKRDLFYVANYGSHALRRAVGAATLPLAERTLKKPEAIDLFRRLGANEASEIEFFQNVTIQGKKVNAGRYVIYCIPYEDKWTIILNNDIYTWGLKIDSTKDLMKFDIPVKKAPVNFEYFTMVFQPISNGAELVMAWDDTEARLPINF